MGLTDLNGALPCPLFPLTVTLKWVLEAMIAPYFKAIVPMAIATLGLFPVLSHFYGAAGTGIAALLATAVWLAAYLYYYRKFMKLPEIY